MQKKQKQYVFTVDEENNVAIGAFPPSSPLLLPPVRCGGNLAHIFSVEERSLSVRSPYGMIYVDIVRWDLPVCFLLIFE
jgi:hypothetical protein